MAIQGLRNFEDFSAARRPENYRQAVALLYPEGNAPLYALMSGAKERSVDDSRYHWFEKRMQTRRLKLAASATAVIAGTAGAVQTITLDATDGNGKSVKAGDVLYVEQTGEIMQVAQDPASDVSLVVVRGFAGSTPATVNTTAAGINPFLVVAGNAMEDGSLAPTGVSFDPTEYSNRTQIFRHTFEMTRRASKTFLRTGDEVRETKRECLEIHSADIERAMWLSKQSLGTKNGQPVTTMDGVIQRIPATNIKTVTSDFAGGLTMEGLEEYLRLIFQFGSSEKVAFCGGKAQLTIGQVLRKNAQWQFTSGIKEYGMRVSRLDCPFGSLVMKRHPLFNQLVGGTTAGTAYHGMESWMAVLDMSNIQYVKFKDDDTKYEPNLQSNGLDGMKSGYLTDCSVETHLGETHFLLKNVVAAAADS